MAFPAAFLDELRARIGLAQLIGRRVKLQKAGREWKGCCPFHNEKTPSFYVNEDKGFYHCFGCGEHGSALDFVMKQDGLSFPEAVRSLAAEAGLEVPEETPEARQRAKAQAGLHEIMAQAADWYTQQLGGISGANARSYIEKRRLTPDTVRAFGLGYAPDGNRLKSALKEVGEARLLECGLLGSAEDRDEVYDRFRNRLMFPIRDPRGRVVGFGGRVLGDGQPKYLNSPDTPLFDKGRLLYNLDKAGPIARKSGRLIVVEGYMDVIAIAQAGVAEGVAPLGTALTEQQLALLWRVVPEPILCFDGDGAGQRAALRAALRALPLLEPGRSLRFATLPAGQDPDDLVRSGGAAAFEAVLAAAEPLIEKLWRAEIEGVDLKTPERRAAARAALRDHAKAIADPTVRALYEAEFRDRFDAQFLARRETRTTQPWRPGAPPPPPNRRPATKGNDDAVWTNALLVGLMNFPELAHDLHEPLAELDIADERLSRLKSVILDAAVRVADLDKSALGNTLAEYNMASLADEVRRANHIHWSFTRPGAPLDMAREDLGAVLDNLVARRHVAAALAEATARMSAGGDEADYEEQQRLLRERDRLNEDMKRLAQTRREAAD
ncbi:MAG: DNA primase [Alphaproteobacteria bacterium]|nr:DNA primase [Alphaproteobacteria bacterium]